MAQVSQVEAIDAATLWVWLGFWPVWLGYEIFLLIKRGQRVNVRTLSMVARDKGWALSSAVYLWNGLASHWWVPGLSWATVPGSAAFWLIAVALAIWDGALWGRPTWAWPAWQRWARFPALVMLAGLLAGWLLFPQRGATPWGP